MDNATTIVYSLDMSPHEWESDQHYLRHKPSGLVIWIANGLFFIDSDSYSNRPSLHLGLIGKWMVWRAFKRWRSNQLDSELISKKN